MSKLGPGLKIQEIPFMFRVSLIYHMCQHSKQVESSKLQPCITECKLRGIQCTKPSPVCSPQIMGSMHPTDSISILNCLFFKGFQGKNGPPGPPGVVGPQVRGSDNDLS